MRRLGTTRLGVGLLALSALAGPVEARSAHTRAEQQALIPLAPYLASQASLEAAVKGVRGRFMFDTGEGLTSVSPQFAAKIGCMPWGRVTGFRMSGERIDTPHCDELDFQLAGRTLHAPAVLILDIMKLMGDGGPRIDGAMGLDVFAGQTITILPRKAIVIETPESLARRVARATPLKIRLVRDAEGLSLAVNGAVKTPKGDAYMELDSGNGGSLVVANHIAPLLGMPVDMSTPTSERFELGNGLVVEGKTRTRDLIMDGNIGAQFLNRFALTLDLKNGRAWLTPFDEKTGV
jgi:hypothetical protein